MANPFKQFEPIDLSRKSSAGWIEESCNLAADCSSGVQVGFLSLALSRGKIFFYFLLIFIALGALFIRSFHLQILSGQAYYALAENNRVKIEYNKAHRGVFLDRNGQVLVSNLFGFSVALVPAELPKDEALKNQEISRLAAIIGIAETEINDRLAKTNPNYYQPVPLRVGLPYDRAMQIKIDSDDFPGVELNVDAWRLYPNAESFSHLLGYIGKINAEEYADLSQDYLFDDNIGKAGLEKQYEKYLKGVHGQKRIEVDALGREKKVISQNNFVPGANVVLSIDAGLQDKVYEVLKNKLPAGKGSVVVADCRNGEILALVDYPGYDNNLFTGGIRLADYQALLNDERKPLFNRSILGEYPSGSTIKPVVAAAALQEKVITAETTVNSTGGLYVGRWFFPDWKGGGHGVTNVRKAIAWSVNTFFYYVGGGFGDFKGLGLEKLVQYYKLFGLGQKTGIDLPGEQTGFVPDEAWKERTKKELWYIGDTYHLSIGQGDLLVTPLQINTAISAIASGGRLFVPKLAVAAIYPDGNKELFPAKVISELPITAENLRVVREGMRQTVLDGSAGSLRDLPVAVAGKTGTAQWNSNKPNHAWFTGFAPYDNPEFCITVLAEEGGEGSATATLIAKEIIKWWFSR